MEVSHQIADPQIRRENSHIGTYIHVPNARVKYKTKNQNQEEQGQRRARVKRKRRNNEGKTNREKKNRRGRPTRQEKKKGQQITGRGEECRKKGEREFGRSYAICSSCVMQRLGSSHGLRYNIHTAVVFVYTSRPAHTYVHVLYDVRTVFYVLVGVRV